MVETRTYHITADNALLNEFENIFNMKLDLTDNNNPEKSVGIVEVIDKRYFTPEIEDIRVGYECEIWWNWNALPENEWCSVKMFQEDTKEFDVFDFIERIPKNEIRVPYLTKEQIEGEGWKCFDDNQRHFFKNKIVVRAYFDAHALLIGRDLGEVLYRGECRCINDFRYITKLLNIK